MHTAGKLPQLRFLTKRSYLNDRFQAQAYLKVSLILSRTCVFLHVASLDSRRYFETLHG